MKKTTTLSQQEINVVSGGNMPTTAAWGTAILAFGATALFDHLLLKHLETNKGNSNTIATGDDCCRHSMLDKNILTFVAVSTAAYYIAYEAVRDASLAIKYLMSDKK